MTDSLLHCWHCNGVIPPEEQGRRGCCPHCQRDSRCCRNCRFHDPGAYNACRENQAERVVDKEKANFCDYFIPAGTAPGMGRPAANPGESARRAAEALFRKQPVIRDCDG